MASLSPTAWFARLRLSARRRYEIRKEGRIDVLDGQGMPTGETAHIYGIHERGLWHRTANVYIVNSRGEVLLQKRSAFVRVFPNLWSLSSGGHVRAGQTAAEAAVAEVGEELGLAITQADLIPIAGSTKEESQPGGHDREFQANFVVHKDIDLAGLATQKHEVGGLAWMPVGEYRRLVEVKHPDHVLHASLAAFFAYIDSHGTDKR